MITYKKAAFQNLSVCPPAGGCGLTGKINNPSDSRKGCLGRKISPEGPGQAVRWVL